MRHVWTALMVLILCAGPAAAQTEQDQPTPEALSGVYACAGIQTDAERLACYDAAVGRMRQAETEGQFVAVERAQVETMRRESFGFSLPSVGNLFGGRGGDELTRVELEIARVIGLADGRHIFVMTDGQRWVQIEPRRTSNVRPGDTVTVRRAALGSFMLVSERGGAAHRVRREG
jgi:hypothetical protein